MWWIVAAGVLIFLLIYLLFAPLILKINSIKGIFSVRYHYLGAARLYISNDTLMLEWRLAFWKNKKDLLESTSQKKPAKERPTPKVKKKKKMPLKLFIVMLRSFRINKFWLTMDTGNNPLNGIWFPWVYFMAAMSRQNISINFKGENELIVVKPFRYLSLV